MQNHKNLNLSSAKMRNASIELYRLLLMFLIVLHHAAAHGYWAQDTVLWSIPLLFTVPTFWHVDGFLTITGWYGTTFTLSHFTKIWGVLMFYTLIDFLFNLLCCGNIYLHTAGGWFAKVYLFFLCLTPFLNAALAHMVNVDKNKFYVAWFLFNIALILDWIPTHLFSCIVSGQGWMSLLLFIAIYLNVGMFRISGIINRVKVNHLAVCCLVCLIGVVTFSILPAVISFAHGSIVAHMKWVGMTTYNAPHVYLMAITTFVAFVKFISVPSWLSPFILRYAHFMFGVYVLHATTSFGKYLYILPQQYLSLHCQYLHPTIIIFTSALICFVCSIIVEHLRYFACIFIPSEIQSMVSGIDKRYFHQFITYYK